MPKLSLNEWMEEQRPEARAKDLLLLPERPGKRAVVQAAIEETVKDHLVGLEILARIGGYEQTLAVIRNKLPMAKRIQSGDFGEIMASEYIDQCTGYRVP